jgi:hypothetical protein
LAQIFPNDVFCIPGIGSLQKGRTPEAAVGVNGRYPQCAGGGCLERFVLFLLPGYLDNQIQEIIRASAIVNADEKIRKIITLLTVHGLWDCKTDIQVLQIGLLIEYWNAADRLDALLFEFIFSHPSIFLFLMLSNGKGECKDKPDER